MGVRLLKSYKFVKTIRNSYVYNLSKLLFVLLNVIIFKFYKYSN